MASNPRPYFHQFGHNTSGIKYEITCVETGVTYANQTECARILKLTPSQLSAHLAGKPSHHFVKGMTFRRGR